MFSRLYWGVKYQLGIGFGGSGITHELFDWVRENVDRGSTVVELGAGFVSTRVLSRRYDLYSVEQNPKYIGRFRSHYILAPVDSQSGWYAFDKNLLPATIDLLLIDGPSGEGNRTGIKDNLDIVRRARIVMVDDTWRSSERDLANNLAQLLNYTFEDHEHFCVLTRDSKEVF